jgi:octaprenyl-diphosphate synthase
MEDRGFLRLIETDLNQVKARMKREINGNFKGVYAHIINDRGKYLRPTLLLLSARACNYKGRRGINLAAAVELIHTASLAHDDVVDNARYRRGHQTINNRWGNKVSILIGDSLFTKAIASIISDGNRSIMEILANSVTKMCEGEIQDTLRSNSMTEKGYINMITNKTASFTSACCEVGAILAGGSKAIRKALSEYGRNLGIGFQIVDDTLDFIGDSRVLGKETLNDSREKKSTLPIIYLLRSAGREDRRILKEIFELPRLTKVAAAKLTFLLTRYGCCKRSLTKAARYLQAAKEKLEPLGEGKAKDALRELADYCLYRES